MICLQYLRYLEQMCNMLCSLDIRVPIYFMEIAVACKMFPAKCILCQNDSILSTWQSFISTKTV